MMEILKCWMLETQAESPPSVTRIQVRVAGNVSFSNAARTLLLALTGVDWGFAPKIFVRMSQLLCDSMQHQKKNAVEGLK